MRYKPHYSSILRLGAPIVLGQLGNVILGFIDTMMVGHYSAEALSSAGFVTGIFNLGIVALIGFSFGATPIIGAYYGRKENDNVGAAFKDSIYANLLCGALVTLIYAALYLNLHNLGQPEELLPVIRPYFFTFLLTMPFIVVFNCLKQFTDTVAATKTAMWAIITGNVANVILNYLLIYGVCGFPRLGLTGAGIATLISRVIMVAIICTLIKRQKKFRVYSKGFKQHSARRKEIANFFAVGTPMGLQMGMETASFSLASLLMGWLGATELAAFQVMCITGSLCFLIYYGIGAAMSIRMSHFRGRGDWTNVHHCANAGLHIILFTAIILSALIATLRYEFAAMFTSDTSIQTMFTALLVPMLAYQISDGIQTNYANALRGIEVTKPLGIYAFISYICLALPASYILGFVLDWGAMGVACGLPVGLTVAAALYYSRFRKEILTHISHEQK
ncbi:MAG: MATE family efflux transporter [Bacteroidaceae bacterium]|nr:MATE family efflux transporter [Bacteroidaceae bacterium]